MKKGFRETLPNTLKTEHLPVFLRDGRINRHQTIEGFRYAFSPPPVPHTPRWGGSTIRAFLRLLASPFLPP